MRPVCHLVKTAKVRKLNRNSSLCQIRRRVCLKRRHLTRSASCSRPYRLHFVSLHAENADAAYRLRSTTVLRRERVSSNRQNITQNGRLDAVVDPADLLAIRLRAAFVSWIRVSDRNDVHVNALRLGGSPPEVRSISCAASRSTASSAQQL
jgi:hypothetical protein